jgi:hypothetical protein
MNEYSTEDTAAPNCSIRDLWPQHQIAFATVDTDNGQAYNSTAQQPYSCPVGEKMWPR